jgi:PAS domain S-box-containing protein
LVYRLFWAGIRIIYDDIERIRAIYLYTFGLGLSQDDKLSRKDKSASGRGSVELATAADAWTVGVWTLGLDGRVSYANREARAALGRSLRRRWTNCWPHHARFSAERAFQAAARGEATAFHSRIGWGGRGQVYVETTITPILGRRKAVTGFTAVMRDITPQWEKAAFLNSMIELLPMPLTVRDLATDRYVLANSAAEELLQVEQDGLDGKTPEEALKPVRAKAIRELDAQTLRTGVGQFRLVSEVLDEQGRNRVLRCQRVATFDDSGPRHVVTLSEDITEAEALAESLRRARDHAERANGAKDAFLAKVSHEIRTPLHAIVASLDLLTRHAGAGVDAEIVRMARSAGLALEAKLQKALDLVELDQGRVRLNPVPFRLDELLQAACEAVSGAAKDRGLDLTWTAGALAGATVLADVNRLRRIIGELLDNAIKFTAEGSVRLTAEPSANGLRITVADTGPGVGESDRERLLHRFHQQDQTLAGDRDGLGLGLALASELAGLMDGHIDFTASGGGSVFWLEAPIEILAAAEPAPAETVVRPRVLVADDHPTNCRLVELVLDELADVISVADGEAAVSAYCSQPFDLVLMDIKMPVMDGIAAVAEIRRFEAERARVRTPIVMLTANVDPDHLDASRAAGADRHIGKPFTADLLIGAVQDALAGPADAVCRIASSGLG